MSKRIKTGALAKLLGISRQRISDLARENKITRSDDGLWNPDLVREELQNNLDSSQMHRVRLQDGPGKANSAKPGVPSANESFNRARAAKEMALAKERELELRKRKGELLDKMDVEQEWTRRLVGFKNILLSIPNRLAQRLAAITDDKEIKALLAAEIGAAMQSLIEDKQFTVREAR